MDHYDEFITLRPEAEMLATAERMEQKFHLPGFAYGIDGMLVRYEGAPRGLEQGPGMPTKQDHFCRKMFYAQNCMVIGDDRKLILGMDPHWHGATHDAKVWRESVLKPLIESKKRFYLAGDSAYPISDVLMKPYSNEDALYDATKALFNSRLCGIRTMMTENLFALWQRRFPILNHNQMEKENVIATVSVTGILHNISILWNDEMPEGAEEENHLPQLPPPPEWEIVADDATPDVIRQRGQTVRDTLMARMPRRAIRERNNR